MAVLTPWSAQVDPHPPSSRESVTREALGAGLVATATLALAGVVTAVVDADPTGSAFIPGLLAAAGIVGLVAAAARSSAGRTWPQLVLGLTAGGCAGLLVAGLHGTRWGLWGVFGDQSFRTQMVTRFADSAELTDYGYQGLPAYYPPLLHWLVGRTDALLGQPAWAMQKYLEVAACLLIPIGAYVLWRRILGPTEATAVVVATTLLVGDPYKPEQWLVLALAVPWWLDAFRGVRRLEVRARRLVVDGAVAGLLVMTYTFYFLPLAVATLLTMAVDRWSGRRWRDLLWRPAGITAVGLVVAAPYWAPLVGQRLGGAAWDTLQLRWYYPGIDDLPVPLPVSVEGVLMALGLLGVACRVVRGRLARHLLLLSTVGYLTLVASKVAAEVGLSFIGAKAVGLAVLPLAALGALTGVGLAARWLPRLGATAPARSVLVAVTAMGVASFGAAGFLAGIEANRAIYAAQDTRYPDGSLPVFGEAGGSITVAYGSTSRTSVQEIREALGTAADSGSVVVTTRTDLLATTPLHTFTAALSIYSHPLGEFAARLDLLRELADTRDPSAVADRLRTNPFDPVDALVLEVADGRFVYSVFVDAFPDGIRLESVEFEPAVFDSADFEVERLGDWVVILVR